MSSTSRPLCPSPFSQEEEASISGINVTPFVDVMLVLLVIFMATTTSIVEQQFRVSLPAAETGEGASKTTKPNELVFTLESSGILTVKGQLRTLDQVGEEVQKARASSPLPLQVILQADEKTPHGKVVELMDRLRKSQILDFGIQVQGGEVSGSGK